MQLRQVKNEIWGDKYLRLYATNEKSSLHAYWSRGYKKQTFFGYALILFKLFLQQT